MKPELPRYETFLITCEHASNAVPKAWGHCFAGHGAVLDTHRAWDPGAAHLARALGVALQTAPRMGEITRLLVDLNRREEHPKVHSEFTPNAVKAQLVEQYHRPWRQAAKAIAAESARAGRAVLHLSCHSFTPVLDGKERKAEIGLLYDPSRGSEAAFSQELRKRLKFSLPGWRIRMNYPYRGTSDGVTSWLRESLANEAYTGIEIELNQAFAAKPAKEWAQARKALTQAVLELTRFSSLSP